MSAARDNRKEGERGRVGESEREGVGERGIEMTEREKESEVEVWEKGGREGYEGE